MRLFISTVIGILLGLGIGLYVGWVAVPLEYTDSPLSDLNPRYQETYTLMVAEGYLSDGDIEGALRRLSALGVDNVPLYVQELTERYITTSRDVNDIRILVALSAGLGRLTPPMENFQQLSPRNDGEASP